MTLSELQIAVFDILGDANQQRWNTTQVDRELNNAQLAVQKLAKSVKTTATYTPTADVAEVTISALVIDIVRATFTLADGTIKGEKNGFAPISRFDLDFKRPNWMNEGSGEPECWFIDASNQQVVLVPKPDAGAANTNALTLYEIRQPTAMAAAADEPFNSTDLMVPFHRALIYWAAAELLRYNQDEPSLAKAKYFRSDDRSNPGLFETELRQILGLFDVPEAMPATVRYQPQGGRISGSGMGQKSNPLGWGIW